MEEKGNAYTDQSNWNWPVRRQVLITDVGKYLFLQCKIKVKSAMKAHRGSRDIALLFL